MAMARDTGRTRLSRFYKTFEIFNKQYDNIKSRRKNPFLLFIYTHSGRRRLSFFPERTKCEKARHLLNRMCRNTGGGAASSGDPYQPPSNMMFRTNLIVKSFLPHGPYARFG